MKSLHRRLVTLDQGDTRYELDYIVMKSGFVYRHARVLAHDEESISIAQDNYPETYLAINEIASARVNRL